MYESSFPPPPSLAYTHTDSLGFVYMIYENYAVHGTRGGIKIRLARVRA